MEFVQIIDFETEYMGEIRALLDEWDTQDEPGDHQPTRSVLLKDRDNANRFYVVVEFPSHEQAMRNSEDPRTSARAQRLESLCSRPTRFVNCDVLDISSP